MNPIANSRLLSKCKKVQRVSALRHSLSQTQFQPQPL